jgi:hypothetical protein
MRRYVFFKFQKRKNPQLHSESGNIAGFKQKNHLDSRNIKNNSTSYILTSLMLLLMCLIIFSGCITQSPSSAGAKVQPISLPSSLEYNWTAQKLNVDEIFITQKNPIITTISSEGSNRLYDAYSILEIFDFSGKSLYKQKLYFGDALNDIAVSSDGNYLISSFESKIKLFDISKVHQGKIEILWTLDYQEMDWRLSDPKISINHDGSRILVIFDVINRDEITQYYLVNIFDRDLNIISSFTIDKFRFDFDFRQIRLAPDGEYFILNSCETIYCYGDEGKILWKRNPPSKDADFPYYLPIDISEDSNYVIFSDSYWWHKDLRNLYLINRDGKLIWQHEFHEDIEGYAISQDGKYVIVATGEVLHIITQNGNDKAYEIHPENKINKKPFGNIDVCDIRIDDNHFVIAVTAENLLVYFKR